MLQRLLSFFGLSPSLPYTPSLPSGGGGGGSDAPDTDGQASITYTPGKKLAAAAEVDEAHDERRERITDADLVWPGKTESIHFRNEEPIAYRFDLTVTDLDPSLYVRRPPVGGAWQPQGGVLLQPREETAFEVAFVPPPDPSKAVPRTFSFVITGYDPRRANDPGTVYGDLPTRWVALPTGQDLKLSARPASLITRPWRRAAAFALDFLNKSELPPSVKLQILRGPTKEALADKGENVEAVGTLVQSLPSRTPCTWHCLLPPPATRGSYYATATGTARVIESAEYPLGLARPVHVRYVGWLRMGRDWLFLFCFLFLLMWLAWGIPVHKAPVVNFKLGFSGLAPGSLPNQAQWGDLQLQLQLYDGTRPVGNPITGAFANGATCQLPLPAQWYGYRWPLGWNGSSRDTLRFKATVVVPDSDKQAQLKEYDLTTLRSLTPTQGDPTYFSVGYKDRPFFGEWVAHKNAIVSLKAGIRVNVYIDDVGAAKDKALAARAIKITAQYQGQSTVNALPCPYPPPDPRAPLASDLDLNAPDTGGVVEIWATAGDIESSHFGPTVMTAQKAAVDVHLKFPVLIVGTPSGQPVAGKPFTIPIQGSANGTKVTINGKEVTLRATPGGITIDVPKDAPKLSVKIQPPGGAPPIVKDFGPVKPPPPPPVDHGELAYEHLLKNENDQALDEAAKTAGGDPMAHAVKAYVFVRKSLQVPADQQPTMLQQAKEEIDAAASAGGRAGALALTAYGFYYDVKGDEGNAATEYAAAKQTNPDLLQMYIAYAGHLNDAHHPEDATDLLRRAIRDGHIKRDAWQYPLFSGLASELGVQRP